MDEERQRFEQWYATHALNHERDPIGSRDCGLQWAAWQAGSESHRAELAELRRFRKAIMDYDSNLYDALADSDACMTPEEIARARLCLRCGVPFKERGVGCSYMGVDYGRHLWPKNEGLNND